MRIDRVRIQDFKGTDVEIPWASAMVLFGANDSGKTRLLEALLPAGSPASPFRWGSVPAWQGRLASLALDVELDGLDLEGHPDQEIFLAWFLSGDTGVSELVEDEAWNQLEAVLRAGRDEYAQLTTDTTRPRAVADLVAYVQEGVGALWDALLARDSDLGELAIRTGAEVARWRRFRVRDEPLQWLLPRSDGRPEEATQALVLFPPQIRRTPHIGSFLKPLDISVVPIRPAPEALTSLAGRLEEELPRLSNILREAAVEDAAAQPEQAHDPSSADAWLMRRGDLFGLRPAMVEACRELTARVNALTPPFVSASYEIEIRVLAPDQWADSGCRVAVQLHARGGDLVIGPAQASSGVATWTNLAVSEALRLTKEQIPHGRGSTIYLFDEPETHLHPMAQAQAASWIADRAKTGATVLLATHAVPFLQLPLEDVEYLKVTRSPKWATTVERITDDVLGAVAKSAESMGLPPVALIQLTRAWLVVEGEHDRMILEAFHGRELHQAGVQILPLRGAMRAEASFLNLAALAPLGLPFFCLLDNTRAEAVRTGRIDVGRGTEEERVAEQLWRLREEKGVAVEVLGLPYPDILCALPIEAVREIAGENGGKQAAATSWSDLIERHEQRGAEVVARSGKPPNFKTFVMKSLGLNNWSADRLVAEVLRVWDGQPPPAGPLSQIVSHVVAAVDDRGNAPGGSDEPLP